MSKIYINGVALPNSEYNVAESRWTRGYVMYSSVIEGSTVGDRHQLSITVNSDRLSATGYTQSQLDDINGSDTFQTLPIWAGDIGANPVQLTLINPNAIVRPVARYSLYRTTSGTSSIQFNSTTITNLKRNTSNSRVQKAIVLLQGSGGSGGTGTTSVFAVRDAAGGGSGATQLVLTDLYTNLTSGISVAGPGIAPTGTASANGVAGGTASLSIFQGSTSTPSNTFTSSGGGGGSSDVPNPPVGGSAGTHSQSYNPFPFATLLYSANGAVGGSTGTGGGIGTLNATTGISGEFFGTYINTTSDTANNKTRFIDFTATGDLGTVTLTGTTAKSGGTRPSGGGAGGAASRYGRGGNGKATTSGSANDGLYGSGGGGGNAGVGNPNNIGATGGGGFVVLFF